MIDDIVREILDGNVVILPTETVYGIGCLPECKEKIFALKNRPINHLTFAYASVNKVLDDLTDEPYQKMVVQKLLPGPFTLLVNTKNAGKIGVRVPDHDICVEILSQIGRSLVLTSANLHKEKPATTFEQASAVFPQLKGIDGGKSKYSSASMILDLSNQR